MNFLLCELEMKMYVHSLGLWYLHFVPTPSLYKLIKSVSKFSFYCPSFKAEKVSAFYNILRTVIKIFVDSEGELFINPLVSRLDACYVLGQFGDCIIWWV